MLYELDISENPEVYHPGVLLIHKITWGFSNTCDIGLCSGPLMDYVPFVYKIFAITTHNNTL